MTRLPVLCIGAVLWDVVGRTDRPLRPGADVPGRIVREPGGVAMNVALALARLGLRPVLLSVVGRDAEGEELLARAEALGCETRFVARADRPTDRYMAIEGADGLFAAIADARSLEAAGAEILAPLRDGRLAAPWRGPVVLDGNLTEALLSEIAMSEEFAGADLRVAPASPGKAERLRPLIGHPGATLYVNLEEAEILCGAVFPDAEGAARGLVARGAARALVTDGGRPAADAIPAGVLTARPAEVAVARVTGAGDSFVAAHLAAEVAGEDRPDALAHALGAAAAHVSGGVSA